VRVGSLEDDFVIRQETTLLCVVRAGTESAVPGQITLRSEDGRVATMVIDDADERVLQNGGMLQIWHDFLEPRKQTLQLAFGSTTSGTDVAYLHFEPVRDRLNVLEIDLSHGPGLDHAQASLWAHPDPSAKGDHW
jgi:hypothetical protein